MKVGTDGVLLGAWCRIEERQRRILDVGCGTGLIAIMAAQRSETYTGTTIDAVEIDEGAARQAAENVAASPWPDRIKVIHAPFQQLPPEKYDHIISNPPYFRSSLECPDAGRTLARHTVTLPFGDLLSGVGSRLATDGIFSVILPHDAFGQFVHEAAVYGLYPSRITDVYPTARSAAPKRTLAEFSFTGTEPVRGSLRIEERQPMDYNREYVELTRDFYLRFE